MLRLAVYVLCDQFSSFLLSCRHIYITTFNAFSFLFGLFFVFSSRRRYTVCALVTGVQTCALPISQRRRRRWQPTGRVSFRPWKSSVPVREHAGTARLIAAAWRQEATALLAALFGGGGSLGRGQGIGSTVRRDDRGEVGELLRLKGEELIAGLGRLERTGGALAAADERRHLGAVGVDVADDAGLHAHRVLKAVDRVLPALARAGDQLLVGSRDRGVAVGGLECLVDLLDVERDVLRFGQQRLRPLDRLLDLLERGVRQAREVARLVDQRLRLVL